VLRPRVELKLAHHVGHGARQLCVHHLQVTNRHILLKTQTENCDAKRR
jgi:hypothetical protein